MSLRLNNMHQYLKMKTSKVSAVSFSKEIIFKLYKPEKMFCKEFSLIANHFNTKFIQKNYFFFFPLDAGSATRCEAAIFPAFSSMLGVFTVPSTRSLV